jgi:hypothetical protein
MVDIYVGTENTHWILHEKLLLLVYSPRDCAVATFGRSPGASSF